MMTFNVRPLELDDYDTYLVGWWNDWGWEAPVRDFLPLDGVGGMMVLDIDGTPICAGFVYLTNSKVAWVDWIISNKGYKKKPNRTYAIRLLIEKLTNYCEDSDAKYCYALIKHKGLQNAYESLGYQKADSYSQEMIKIL